jgi:hypothetical protein
MKGKSFLAGLAVLLLLAGPVRAAEPDACLACHGRDLGGRQVTLGSLAWSGPVEAETLLPCPGVVRAKQELFLTESRLVRLSGALAALEVKGVRVGKLSAELHRLSDRYRTLLRQPVTSLSSLSAKMVALRSVLDTNVQKPMLRLQRARSRLTWLGMALVVGLAVLLAGMVGWRRRLGPPSATPPLQLAREGRLHDKPEQDEAAESSEGGGKP